MPADTFGSPKPWEKTVWDQDRFWRPFEYPYPPFLPYPSEWRPPTYSIPGTYPEIANLGWICPRCQRVHAPHIDQCIYCNSTITEVLVSDNTDNENE